MDERWKRLSKFVDESSKRKRLRKSADERRKRIIVSKRSFQSTVV